MVSEIDPGKKYQTIRNTCNIHDRTKTVPEPLNKGSGTFLRSRNCLKPDFNSYSQFDYDADIRSIVLFLVPCPHCSARGAFIFYGHYSRSYFSLTDGSICFLRIQRVRCRHCHHTHALLPHFLVPFRRFQLGHLLSFAYWKKTYPPSLNSLCDRFPWHDKSVIHRLCKHISPWLMKHDISPSYCSLVVFLSLYPCFDSYPFCSAPRKNISFLFLPT